MSLVYESLVNGSIRDSSGNGNNGTLTAGASRGFVQTSKGLAMEFDAADTKVDTGSDFVGTGAETISAWIYPKSLGESSVGWVMGNDNTVFRTGGTNSMQFFSDGSTIVNSGNNSITLNAWQHVLVTRNAAGDETNFYINGVLSGSANQDSGTPASGATNIFVGGRGTGAAVFDGFISNVKVYDEVIDASKRAELYDEFLKAQQTANTKKNFIYPKPTDLSNEVQATLGSELVTNGSFDNWTGGTLDDWTNTAVGTSTITEDPTGSVRIQSPDGDNCQIDQNIGIANGESYKVVIDVTQYNSGSLQVGEVSGTFHSVTQAVGTYTVIITGTGTSPSIRIKRAGPGADVSIGCITVKKLNGLVAAYNMIPNNDNLIDISGKGNTASKNGVPISTLEGVEFHKVNDEYYGVSSLSPSLDGSSNGSICVRFKPSDITSGNRYLVCLPEDTTGSNGFDIRQSGDDVIGNVRTGGSGVAPEGTAVLVAGKWVTAVLTYDGSNAKIYVNGVLEDTVAKTGTLETASDELNIGDFGSFDAPFDGEISDVKVYDYALSQQEAKDYHNSFATQVNFKEDFSDAGADGIVKTPRDWLAGTGSYKIDELTSQDSVLKHLDIGTKYLENTSDGTIATQSSQAYGTWEFDVYKGADGNSTNILFIQSENSNNSSGNSYELVFNTDERVVLNKDGSNIFYTATSYIAINTWYRIKITRTLDGEFTVYIRGGSFGDNDWTLVDTTSGSGSNPVTDTTYTTSKYSVLDFDSADLTTNIKYTKGVKQ